MDRNHPKNLVYFDKFDVSNLDSHIECIELEFRYIEFIELELRYGRMSIELYPNPVLTSVREYYSMYRPWSN